MRLTAKRQGRLVIYRVTSPAIAEVIASLSWAATGGHKATSMTTPEPLRTARACYDHLAGAVGVQVFKGLVEHEALTDAKFPWDEVEIGPQAGTIFQKLGLDFNAHMANNYRRLAFGCPDWSEPGKFHLGGFLGAALFAHFLDKGWIERRANRAVSMTDSGKAALGWLTSEEA